MGEVEVLEEEEEEADVDGRQAWRRVRDSDGEVWFEPIGGGRSHWHRPILQRPMPAGARVV